MNRRGFLAAVIAAPIVAKVGPLLPAAMATEADSYAYAIGNTASNMSVCVSFDGGITWEPMREDPHERGAYLCDSTGPITTYRGIQFRHATRSAS